MALVQVGALALRGWISTAIVEPDPQDKVQSLEAQLAAAPSDEILKEQLAAEKAKHARWQVVALDRSCV